MREVAIVSPVRTAVGNFGGTLRDISAADLASVVIKEALGRTQLDPARVDDVILGHGYPSGENPAIGRLASLKAGLPIEVPGYQLDRRCFLRSSSDSERLYVGADRQCRRGDRRRSREHEQCRVLCQRVPMGSPFRLGDPS